jgi:hypothetical protein
MNILLTNPYLFLLVVIWVICGIVSIFHKNCNALCCSLVVSLFIGWAYLMIHRHP